MNDQPTTLEERIDAKIDKGTLGEVAISERTGGMDIDKYVKALEVAKSIAVAGIAIPKHLRGNPGACLAVLTQALEWGLSAYAVANKSYSVNDRLAYESQLIQAVILKRAPIIGRFKVEYSGEGEGRRCRVWATLRPERRDDPTEIVEYISPPLGKIPVKNSPLWKGDPDQQLFYYSGRALCRRHFPDVLLGIYARDEIEDERDPEDARDVTPARQSLGDKLDQMVASNRTEATAEPEIIAPKKIRKASAPKAEEAAAATAAQTDASSPQPTQATTEASVSNQTAAADPPSAAAGSADAAESSPVASAAPKAMMPAHRTGLQRMHADMMGANSMKKLGLAFDAFTQANELHESDAAYKAGEAVLLAHTKRIGGDGSPSDCDAAMNKAIAQ